LRDPNYGPALACAAVCVVRIVGDGSGQDQEADRHKGIDYARRALEVARDDPETLANGAFALACFGEDVGAMLALVDHALELNPGYARGWYISACLRLQAGQPDLAIEHAVTVRQLNPRGESAFGASFVIGAALLVIRRFEEALPNLLVAVQVHPSFSTPHQYLAACYAHLGRLREAREVVARLRTITPLVVPARSVLRDPAHRELLLSGLRLAAGEAA